MSGRECVEHGDLEDSSEALRKWRSIIRVARADATILNKRRWTEIPRAPLPPMKLFRVPRRALLVGTRVASSPEFFRSALALGPPSSLSHKSKPLHIHTQDRATLLDLRTRCPGPISPSPVRSAASRRQPRSLTHRCPDPISPRSVRSAAS